MSFKKTFLIVGVYKCILWTFEITFTFGKLVYCILVNIKKANTL